MRLPIFTIAITIIAALSSCTQLPDLNPSSNDNVVVRLVGWEWAAGQPVSSLDFNGGLDINNNGTIDFRIVGTTSQDPVIGQYNRVRIEGTAPGNAVTRSTLAIETVCGQPIPMATIKILGDNFTVNELTSWSGDAALYWSVLTNGECVDYGIYTNDISYDYEYIGVKFVDEGAIHFGWIQITGQEFTTAGMPGHPERWRIHNVGYNAEPGMGLRIPG